MVMEAPTPGTSKTAEELLPIVYEELRKIAAVKMAWERPGQTLQATALVHEAWLRLGPKGARVWQNQTHFISAAAEAMRRILVEKARRRASKKGGGRERVDLAQADLFAAESDDFELLAIHDALKAFSKENPAHAKLVELRCFGGLTLEEAAQIMAISVRTAKRWWAYARAWLKVETDR